MFVLGVRLVMREKLQSALALLAIAVAVVIMFMEMGFLNALLDSQVRIVEVARGEIVVLDRRRTHLARWDTLAGIRLHQIAAETGVRAALPVFKAGVMMRSMADGPEARIVAYGIDPADPALELGLSEAMLAVLAEPRTVFFDTRSRPIYGDVRQGETIWLNGERFRVGGLFALSPGILDDGVVLLSDGNMRLLNRDSLPVMGVIRVEPDAEVHTLRRRIATLTGDALSVHDKSGLIARELDYLRRVTPIGLLFGAGVAAGFSVGLAVCYQTLFVTLRRRSRAFATFKAMGFGNRFVVVTALTHALLLATGGFVVGLSTTIFCYDVLAERTALVVELTFGRAGFVALLCVSMCAIAALAAARPTLASDPALLMR
jgi:putative ABC transport system permease protein